jgi:predicted negative regulator of RcsB-dependent stress response
MATYDLQEQEQIDDLKAWWDRWGGTVSTGVVIAAIVIAGVQAWRWYSGKKAEEAGAMYQAVSEAIRKNDGPRARDAITQIEDRFAGTGYAPRAALLYARMLYDTGDKAGAKLQLQWALDHADEDEIKAIARYRIAQAQIDDRAYDQALATLDAKHPDAFDGLYADLRGDALAAAGRTAEARAAYQIATSKLDAKSQYQQYVRVKLDALGGAPADALVPPATGDAKAASGGGANAKDAKSAEAPKAAAPAGATKAPAPADKTASAPKADAKGAGK